MNVEFRVQGVRAGCENYGFFCGYPKYQGPYYARGPTSDHDFDNALNPRPFKGFGLRSAVGGPGIARDSQKLRVAGTHFAIMVQG